MNVKFNVYFARADSDFTVVVSVDKSWRVIFYVY